MYTLSSKLKLFSIILMAVGLIGLAIGFIVAPSTIEEVKEMVASHDGHGESHAAPGQIKSDLSEDPDQGLEFVPSEHEVQTGRTDDNQTQLGTNVDDHENEHYEHILHQLQNKPWAALYVAAFFFFMIPLGVLVFYAIQWASQSGWSPVLFRVMEGITSYLLPGGVIIFVLLVLSGLHLNHLFIWMDPEVVENDAIIRNKSGYLNVPFFLIRAAIYIAGWAIFRHFLVKNSNRLDEAEPNDLYYFKKNFKLAAGFLVFFIVTESMMSWDWIMSLDPHWFSTLFGWYVFASMFVSGITMIALVSIYLKSRGFLPFVNDSHIHDLAKFMFGISIFWTYLWFSQFMLIWYSNIPEEVTYFVSRIEDYGILFFGMVVLNFLFPVLLLMNSDFKRVNWFVVMTGLVILLGHYIDIYVMVMPATVGESWFIGLSEISSLLFFGGLFIFVVFTSLTKAPLLARRNPFIKESEHFHY
ncbi:quinol:cytochrome C oxidoreductase [Antarcticibacterium flavum]|uniref:Quinol:cytochrome C oxidoreductase n=1 Tax=Antarcticibacterium flavum TaxID=2058175 RepID=A0A5B7X5W6_9FLAO|nr:MULTISPECIES: quinol:cytochrome C oxidoreductase [Antarcticibacterium]MCM4158348.1 quinol:cytochrome C oxidoreductase [Antarcticibacterium sp. W02-3]QCY70112.1 quinol:cytochrome C oxidoreductase [Antarcticibacterium flavum]